MVETQTRGADWTALISLDDVERRHRMRAWLARLTALDEESRLNELEAMVRAEYQLPAAELHRFTASRLRAWIDLQAADPGQARVLADAYNRVFARVPGDLAMKRAAVLQNVGRTELTEAELAAFDGLLPILSDAIAHRRNPSATRVSGVAAAEEARATGPRKRGWRFW
jgi:hypothetical protein